MVLSCLRLPNDFACAYNGPKIHVFFARTPLDNATWSYGFVRQVGNWLYLYKSRLNWGDALCASETSETCREPVVCRGSLHKGNHNPGRGPPWTRPPPSQVPKKPEEEASSDPGTSRKTAHQLSRVVTRYNFRQTNRKLRGSYATEFARWN